MKTLEQLLDCIEDDMELMGENRIVYLMEDGDTILDYDYLPSADYCEAMRLNELREELEQLLLKQKRSTAGSDNTRKLAVLFPGVGYTCDKPLLYYNAQLVKSLGYEIIRISYYGIPKDIKNNPHLKQVAFENALACAQEQLHPLDMTQYDDVLFISKSVGTIVSAAFAQSENLKVRSIFYTPLSETFHFAQNSAIAFHGLCDDWADSETLIALANEKQIPMYLTKDANHSLETGDLQTDIQNLKTIMKQTEQFILST